MPGAYAYVYIMVMVMMVMVMVMVMVRVRVMVMVYCLAGPGESEEHCGLLREVHWTHSMAPPGLQTILTQFLIIIILTIIINIGIKKNILVCISIILLSLI